MLSGPRLTFRGVTRAIFARLRKKAKQNGIAVAYPTGECVKDGVKIHWKYDPDAELLEVECIHAPFWIDPACMNKELCEEIELELGSGRAA
ncbi:MAG TPA: hypothetical protein VME18_06395 [Acidobacteriaceae bacterium]|nr:hypothetical protein [Acidobacteriaceae bacterium]